MINNEAADEYQKTGKISEAVLNDNRLPRAVNAGGLFLPKTGSKKGLMLFYNLKNVNNGDSVGVIGMAITNATEGSLQYVSYDSEKNILNKIKVLHN